MKRLFIWAMALTLCACSSNNSKKNSLGSPSAEEVLPEEEVVEAPEQEEKDNSIPKFLAGSDAVDPKLLAYYQLEHIREFYEYYANVEYAAPGKMEIPDDLSQLSYGDLRLLRNEVFARKGYLFEDGFLRGYFNKFNWYMPIFEVDSFKVELNQLEQELVNQILAEEAKRKTQNTVPNDLGLDLYNADLIVNTKQFDAIDPAIMENLAVNNFSIVQADRQMPFYTYDQNSYQHIPHYITTDLYLFILHKFFGAYLEKLDEKYMSKTLNALLKDVIYQTDKMSLKEENAEALFWAATYCKLAMYAADQTVQNVDLEFSEVYGQEIATIDAEAGGPSFIPNDILDFRELKPRGHYTNSDELKGYFKSFKWISLNGINLADDEQLKGMLAIAYIIKTNGGLRTQYEDYVGIIEKLAGREDNLSLRDLINVIEEVDTYQDLMTEKTLLDVRFKLGNLDKERVKVVFSEANQSAEQNIKRVYFLSATSSFSGEIFTRLVHVDPIAPKRPVPNALDVPAVFDNETATSILLGEYKEGEKWEEYPARLTALQRQFAGYNDWESNYGAIGVKTALSASAESEEYPNFMKTEAYDRKELSTTLSSWTHIKHDLILYQEKPYAAEAGQGGGPNPPKQYFYVEPNLEFWDQALNLARWLVDFQRFDKSFSYQLNSIVEIGEKCRGAAMAQTTGEGITDEESWRLKHIGAEIEYILLALLENDHLPEREKSMALIADVYGVEDISLSVAVGHADDIYVVVPLNGEYHIARGAVFSYYEFAEKKIYTDDEWKARLSAGNAPARPKWIAPLINEVPNPGGQLEFRYVGHGY